MRLLLALAITLLCQEAFASMLLSEDAFTDQYIRIAQQKHPELIINKVAALEVQLSERGEVDSERTAFLDNAYLTYKNDPTAFNAVMAHYTRSIKNTFYPSTEPLDSKRLFPVIKSKAHIKTLDAMLANAKSKQPSPTYREALNEELYVLYVFDSETTMRFASQEDIKNLAIAAEDLRELAISNLRDAVELTLQGEPHTLSMLIADGNYEASLILLDSLWNKEQFPVKGKIVVYLPSRDLLLITGSEDPEGLAKAKSIVLDPEQHWPHMISRQGFIREGTRWEVFDSL